MSDRDSDRPEETPKPEAPEAGKGEAEAPAGAAEAGKDEAEAKAKAEAAAKAKAAAAAKAKAAQEAAAALPPWERLPEAPALEAADDDPLAAALAGAHPDAIEAAERYAGDLQLRVGRGSIRELCRSLREEHNFRLIEDLCGAHYPDREGAELEVVYHLFDLDGNRRVRLKVRAGEDQTVPSVTPIWRGAGWLEREVYDMYGLRFEGHPDMTRILLWEGFNGHPLRKDFPVEGIDTGSAIYPEYYEQEAGPVTGTGTGWRPQPPPAEEPSEEPS